MLEFPVKFPNAVVSGQKLHTILDFLYFQLWRWHIGCFNLWARSYQATTTAVGSANFLTFRKHSRFSLLAGRSAMSI